VPPSVRSLLTPVLSCSFEVAPPEAATVDATAPVPVLPAAVSIAESRSLTAAALLFAMAVYMVGFVPRYVTTPINVPGTELRAADFPQPPGDPDSNEEVLQSLVETDYGNN